MFWSAVLQAARLVPVTAPSGVEAGRTARPAASSAATTAEVASVAAASTVSAGSPAAATRFWSTVYINILVPMHLIH